MTSKDEVFPFIMSTIFSYVLTNLQESLLSICDDLAFDYEPAIESRNSELAQRQEETREKRHLRRANTGE